MQKAHFVAMPTSSGARVAWALAGATALLTVAGLTILALTLDTPPQGGWGFRGFPTIFAVASGSVGWLIMVRRPDNRIGLVLAVSGLLAGAQLFLTEYAAAGARESLPASNLVTLVNAFIWVPGMTLMAGATPLLFPDGKLPSRRLRPVAVLMTVSAVALIGIIVVYPDALSTPRFVQRVVRLPIDDAVLNQASYVAFVLFGISVVGAVGSLILRWRRATGVVREQLKWLALAAVLVLTTMWFSVVPDPLANAVFIFAIGTVPVAVGIAVLRYRLYEIDAVISRTLVFGALTAILTGLFAALQKLLQTVFVAVTGNESDAATIITTLVLATSFVPLKKALERIVERRLHPVEATVAGARVAGAPVAAVADGAGAGELEALLRRVVREEVRSAIDDRGGPAEGA